MIKKLTFLFWNLNKKPLSEMIGNLVELHDVDILILAECEIPVLELLAVLNEGIDRSFHYSPTKKCKKIQIFSRFELNILDSHERFAAKNLQIAPNINITIIGLHLPSKLYYSEAQRISNTFYSVEFVKSIEKTANHTKTLLIGDFNMNPFESSMISSGGFNGTMTQKIAKKISRTTQGIESFYFYNPCWSLQGDLSKGVAGTHFYPDEYQWQLYDQILMRPSLIDNFEADSLEIITTDGKTNFLKPNGEINKKIASDHLPIKCIFKF